MNFSNKFGDYQTIWYPATGSRLSTDNSLYDIGLSGFYWSTSIGVITFAGLSFTNDGEVYFGAGSGAAHAHPVRCIK
jgi:hypothetical protein